MNSRINGRRSLCPTFKPRKDFSVNNNVQFSETTDNSDSEWENLQSKLHPEYNMNDIAIQEQDVFDEFDNFENIENMPACANIDKQIEAKQKEIERVQQIALDLQDRFVWDLSLAIKKDLFHKNFKNYEKREIIANHGIAKIVEQNQMDPKSPEEWKDWIYEQFSL